MNTVALVTLYNPDAKIAGRIKLLSEQVEKDLIAELNKTDDELSKSLVAFFSDDLNITYFDADALGKLAMNYPMLCSVPSLVWKLNKDKSEIWFNKYKETVTDAKFDNTFANLAFLSLDSLIRTRII